MTLEGKDSIPTDYHYDTIYSNVDTNELLHSCFRRLFFANVSIRCGGKLPPKTKTSFDLFKIMKVSHLVLSS